MVSAQGKLCSSWGWVLFLGVLGVLSPARSCSSPVGSGGIYDAASLILKSLNSFGHGFLGDLSQDNPIKGNFQQK